MPNPVQALREVLGVLKTSGRAVALWGERRKCSWAELFPIVDSMVQAEVCPLFFGLGTGNSLAKAFDEAGFASVRAQRLTATANYLDQHVLTAMLDGGAVALAAKRFDGATRQHVEAMLLAYFPAQNSVFRIVVHGARKAKPDGSGRRMRKFQILG